MRIGYLSTAYHTSHILKKFVKAEWRLFSTGMEIMKAFEKNKIDLAYVGLTPVIYSKDRGLNLTCIAGGHIEGTFIAGRFSNFPECLKGRRVGTLSRGTIHDVILRSVKFHFAVDFEIINYDFAELVLNEFVDGNIDFVCGTPNLIALAEKSGAKVVCGSEELWPWNPSYGIVVSYEFLERRKEEIFDFLIKHEWACNLLREAKEVAVSRIFESFGGDLERGTIGRIVELSPKYCASLPESYIKSTIKLAKFMEELGYVESTGKDIFELSLIKEVHPQEEHYSKRFKGSQIF